MSTPKARMVNLVTETQAPTTLYYANEYLVDSQGNRVKVSQYGTRITDETKFANLIPLIKKDPVDAAKRYIARLEVEFVDATPAKHDVKF